MILTRDKAARAIASASHSANPLFEPERFDWDALTERYHWIKAMRGVPQNPAFHAEGDVWVHTGMVARALLDLPEWQVLPLRERRLLFASALLHDVAKPLCTAIDENGIPASPHHARRGEPMARMILETCAVETYADREIVSKLVRHHGLPLWLLEKSDMDRALARASTDVRLDWVALLAEADVRGRKCGDQKKLLEAVDLFRVAAQDLECYDQPSPFASDHARFMYFRHEDYPLNYAAWDDCTFTATLMSGVPGSGKDTWIKQNAGQTPVISLDAIRRELKIISGQNQSAVFNEAEKQARAFLRNKQPFIWNATNLTRLVREPLIEWFSSYGARIRMVVCHVPIRRAVAQNEQREGAERVPESVIWAMLQKYDPPSVADFHELVIHDAAITERRT